MPTVNNSIDIREEFHKQARLEFVRYPVKRLKEIIFFIDPSLEWNTEIKNKIYTFRPKDMENGDISSNVPHFIKYSEIYKNLDEFIESLKIFVPSDKIEVVNGFLNVYLSKQVLLENLENIVR